MIVLSVIFRCLDPILILGAASNERSLFVSPLERRKEANEARNSFTQGSNSDHIALINAFREMRYIRASRGEHAMNAFARQNFIHTGAFRTIDNTVQQIEAILVEAGLIPYTAPNHRYQVEYGDPQLNENANSVPLIKALILAGTHPNLAVNTGLILHRTPNEGSVMVHPSSTNYIVPKQAKENPPSATLLTYSSMAKSTDGNTLYLRETSQTTPLAAALFGGRLLAKGRTIEMDFWLPFYVRSEPRAVKAILEFKKGLDRVCYLSFLSFPFLSYQCLRNRSWLM
jgi:HrpA-like RNA helicase